MKVDVFMIKKTEKEFQFGNNLLKKVTLLA
jgi:hypothetical protein